MENHLLGAAPTFRAARRPLGASGLGAALLATAVSALVPGLAHLRAGRVRTGRLLLVGWVSATSAVLLVLAVAAPSPAEVAVSPGWLTAVICGSVLVAMAWTGLVIASYAAVRPMAPSAGVRFVGAVAVGLLCALVAAPPLALAHYGDVQRDLINGVFSSSPGDGATGDGAPEAEDARWTGPDRLNVLLLGGDADVGRTGVRTDSVTVASIDARDGSTVLLSLPRNLQHVPVWDGSREIPFPREQLLNAVYEFGERHRIPAGAERPGAELLKRTVSHVLSLPIHHYALIDMRSFRRIIDALGGLRVCAPKAVPVPREQIAAGVIPAGCAKLNGREALWYGRSRTGSSDYARMDRQKCLLWELSRQATPLKVLRGFQRLARAFRESVHTDLPRGLLPGLLDLAGRVRKAPVVSVQFKPPLVRPGAPDYGLIRRTAARTLAADGRGRVSAVHDLGRTCS
ncbi:LytR family transcriptional attenuator [Actinocorallia herbida]|uniref:LytR family transcriptional attenuator n=1 Tax=Actinocorallia herbida TaxID=58109 RepID=A0A3N1D539_9ACTN|nr:LCP family protein [Actinocorallia herbida]ROO88576.1 LytR family transcriptional attenuator [Actinocorallia herbida]